MKQCTKCKQWKDESKFYKQSSGAATPKSSCMECQRMYNRVRYLRTTKAGRRKYTYEESHAVIDGVRLKLCPKCRMC